MSYSPTHYHTIERALKTTRQSKSHWVKPPADGASNEVEEPPAPRVIKKTSVSFQALLISRKFLNMRRLFQVATRSTSDK
jgi:hypothetical protein